MKKFVIKQASGIKVFAVAILVALMAILSLPFNLIGRAAAAESSDKTTGAVTAESSTAAKQQVQTSADGTDVALTVYYYRADGKYTGYNMWVWDYGTGDGANYKNDFNDGTVELPGFAGKPMKKYETTINNVDVTAEEAIGVIVRKNNWEEQTPDMIIPGSEIKDNAVTVYIVSGLNTLYYSAEDAMSLKITNAYFKDYTTVYFETSSTITQRSTFAVKDENGTVYGRVSVNAASPLFNAKSGTISVSFLGGFDFGANYVLEDVATPFDVDVNFLKCAISKTPLYDTEEFIQDNVYDGALGVEYTKQQSVFRLWAPTAQSVVLNIYESGDGKAAAIKTESLVKSSKGVWTATVTGDLGGKYYTYTVNNGGKVVETVDPYAQSGGKNGVRGMIVDFDSADAKPEGWDTQRIPDYGTSAKAMATAVIYEAQLRDLTVNPNSGVSEANRGKFLGLTETGTTNGKGQSTALDYLVELGITQLHLQPIFDFASVDESFSVATYNKESEYNWGYDPLNYNMPEGSYSSDPSNGYTRVKEMREMVMALHNAGIQVIMDVVYNHVNNAAASNFEAIVPGYYFRMTSGGSYWNGSGCGNETASDRAMFRKFMIDSVKYWTEEFKIDGFRFDLMGLHDIDTMNQLYDELVAINPDVVVYGEPWTGGDSGLASSKAAIQANIQQMPNIAAFNDNVRDGLKGSVFSIKDTGFISGAISKENAIYNAASGSTSAFSGASAINLNPTQNINYVSAHDNSTLWDKLNSSVNADRNTLKAMNRLAATAVLTGQGMSFFLAGEEMLRSKPTIKGSSYSDNVNPYLTDPTYYAEGNSYHSPDSVNAIDWDLIDTNRDMVEFYKGLIEIKKTYKQFQITDTAVLTSCITFFDNDKTDGVASYMIKDPDSNQYIVLMFNVEGSAKSISVPQGKYTVIVNGNKVNKDGLSTVNGSKVTVGAYSAVVMVAELDESAIADYEYTTSIVKPAEGSGNGLAIGLGIGIPAAVLVAGGAAFYVVNSKKKKGKGNKAESNGDDNATDNNGSESNGDDNAAADNAEQSREEVKADDSQPEAPASESSEQGSGEGEN